MQNVLIVDADVQSIRALQRLEELNTYRIIGIADRKQERGVSKFASLHNIPYGLEPAGFLVGNVQIVIDFSEDSLEEYTFKNPQLVVFPKCASQLIVDILSSDKKSLASNRFDSTTYESIFNSVEEGMIGIDDAGIIQLLNDSASIMLGITTEEALGKPIVSVLPSTGLLDVLQTGEPIIDAELQATNSLTIISSQYPIKMPDNRITGAFAVFKDVTGVLRTAEEITDLKRVKTMLEAIIHSSDDAISVVDSEGLGILINPAYTRLTGLTEQEVIGQPATVDINSGESIHMKVLETKRAVRGVNMQIGENNRNVIVNVAPIIVDREVKGSVGVIHDITEMRDLMKELDHAKAMIRDLESTYTFEDIIGSNEDLLVSIGQSRIAAASDIPIMLRGESGSGKELFANAIHNGSRKSEGDFIRVFCSSLTAESIETSFFYLNLEKEELPVTLFLDEITELAPKLQKMLLKYLKDSRVGKEEKTNRIRVIASSSANLERAVNEGRLCEELYFELTRISIRIPSLRTRPEDIVLITEVFLAMLNQEFGMSIQQVTSQALKRLQEYDWPGNVRELENVLSRAMILSEAGATQLDEQDIVRALSSRSEPQADLTLPEKRTLASLMEDHEKLLLETSLKENNGQKVATADRLGISIRSLYYKLEKYKLI